MEPLTEKIFSFVFGFGVVSAVTVALTSYATFPKKAYFETKDLNNDGLQDLVIERFDGYKIPMYGVKIGEKNIYTPAEILKSFNSTDYIGIEDDLNKD